MSAYGIGEVEELSGVKAHVLRYWEENVPFLTPQKDSGGRRVYTTRDVRLVLRLKHLIYERKFTLEGAVSQLLDEAASQGTDETVRSIVLLKSELIDLYALSLERRSGRQKAAALRAGTEKPHEN